MNKVLCFIFGMFTILASQFASSQDFIRAGVAGSTKSDYIHGYSIDPQGDLLICGTFQGTIDLDFENGAQSPMTAISKYDIYVAKYDIIGNYIWSFQLGGDPNHYAYVKDIITDMDGNIFITGTSDGWIDFDPSEETDSIKEGTESMAFLAKYNPDGDYLWAHGFGNDDINVSNIGWGLAIDSVDGSVYLLGQINNDLDLDPSAETAILSPDRHADMFLAKYSNDGAYQWARLFTYPGEYGVGGPQKVRVDAERNIYICGYHYGIFDMDPSGEVHSIGTSETYDTNGFLAKYNKEGEYQWSLSLGADQWDAVRNLRILDGYLYVVGDFSDTVDFDPSDASFELRSLAMETSGYLAVYDTGGGFQSAMGIAGEQVDLNYSGSNIDDLDMDKHGDIYLIGSFYGSADFDPSDGTAVMGSTGGISDRDMFLAKYDSDINYQWAIHAGGNSQERGYFTCATLRGEVIAMGYYDGICDFDPSAEEQFKYNNGGHDIFLAWYGAYNTTGIINEHSSDQESVRIYPNPVQGVLNIDSDKAMDRIEIFSITGSLIQSHVFYQNKAVIELPELPQGTYMLRIYQDAGIIYRKFVKLN